MSKSNASGSIDLKKIEERLNKLEINFQQQKVKRPLNFDKQLLFSNSNNASQPARPSSK